MRINWQQKIIWGIKAGELGAFLGVYLFLYLFYTITLTINELAYEKIAFSELLFKYLVSQGIDYTLKLLLTLPLWYLYFRVLKHWSLSQKLILHNFTAFIFVLCWIKSFYFITEALGRGHLRGSSQIWDIYIPALIYIIQFGFFHAYEYHLQIKRQKEIEASLRQAALQSELTAIKAQLNPHFLYNVFNTISASVPPEMEHTREMIATLADMFRYQLRASKEDFVKLKDELTFVEKYLSLEKVRFGSHLTTHFSINEGIENLLVPPMILQPLVENAIKHGISPKIEGGELRVKIEQKVDTLRCEVSDTGVGSADYQHLFGKGIGLTNTQLRLEKMFGQRLHVEGNVPNGLKVWFEIPILTTSR
jgi:sensor histidine kinase YesM